MKGIGTLQRQQFYLGVTSQKICADDNVKGVGVEHFAVLSHLLIAQTNGHIDPPREWMVRPSPTLTATFLVFRIRIFMVIQRTKSSSSEPPPYPSSGKFTSTPAACRHLDRQLRRRFLAFSLLLAAPPAQGMEWAGRFSTDHSPLGLGLGAPLPPVVGAEDLRRSSRVTLTFKMSAVSLANANCTPFWKRRTPKTTARKTILFGHLQHK